MTDYSKQNPKPKYRILGKYKRPYKKVSGVPVDKNKPML